MASVTGTSLEACLIRTFTLSLLFGLMALLSTPMTAWSAPDFNVRSYKEWKAVKIQEVQVRLDAYRGRLALRRNDPQVMRAISMTGRDLESQRLEFQIRSEINALEIAKDLTVSDYFAGYLAKMNNRQQAFKSVASRLTPEEVAELMSAYANSLFGSQSSGMSPSAHMISNEPVR